MSPTATVVICAYTMDRWDQLLTAVQSALEQLPASDEIVVVVDHNDALFEKARRGLPDVRVVENGRTQGLSGARNQGVSESHGEVVVFLDDDAVATPGWLQPLLEVYSTPDVLGAGGWVEPNWGADRPSWFPEQFLWTVGCSYQGLPRSVSAVRNPIGASMSFRRDVILEAGGFNELIGRVGALPLGCEETELSIRALAGSPGGKILLVPQSRVTHHVPASRTTWRYYLSRCWSEGRSKALVAGLAGSDAALASERAFVAGALASGLREQLGIAIRGDSAAARTAAAIVMGLLWTVAGYVSGRFVENSRPDRSMRLGAHAHSAELRYPHA